MNDPTINVTAEQALLGGLLMAPRAIHGLGSLCADDFADGRHGTIYAAVRTVVDRDGPAADHLLILEELRRTGTLVRIGGGAALHSLIDTCPAASNVGWYARQVREAAQMRRVRMLGTKLQQVTEQPDLAVALDNAATLMLELQVTVDTPDADRAPIDGLSSLEEFVDEGDDEYDWVIPGLLERQDRVIVVASEGAGKSTLSRQVAVMLAAGVHPFFPHQRIPAMRTLIVDLENPPSLVRRKTRHLVERARNIGVWSDEHAFRWTKPGGLNLRRPADARLLERVIEETRPALVCLGPLYKAFLAGPDSGEQAAGETAAVLDRIRERYGCALWLEHHAPLAQQGSRDLRPFGSALWSRWPEFGISLRVDPEVKHAVRVDSFRGHRDEREWPTQLKRGHSGDWPWQAVFGELDETGPIDPYGVAR